MSPPRLGHFRGGASFFPFDGDFLLFAGLIIGGEAVAFAPVRRSVILG